MNMSGKVIGDLNSRRAQINESTTQDTSTIGRASATQTVINAFIPLSETFQYTTRLRSMTQGRGAFTLEFSHYEVVPSSLAPGRKTCWFRFPESQRLYVSITCCSSANGIAYIVLPLMPVIVVAVVIELTIASSVASITA